MGVKAQCDEHGCSEMLCGCHISQMESSKDFHEILRAKDKELARVETYNEVLSEMLETIHDMTEVLDMLSDDGIESAINCLERNSDVIKYIKESQQ